MIAMQEFYKNYYRQSAHFAYSILLVLPLLFAYGIGLAGGFDANFGHGMLLYIPQLFSRLLGHLVVNLLVAAGVVAGLVWLVKQYRRKPAKISAMTFVILPSMFLEAALIGFLIVIVRAVALNLHWPSFFTFSPSPFVTEQIRLAELGSGWQMIHASIGAGVFEELVYRVIIIRLLYFAAEGKNQPFGTEQDAVNKAALLSAVFFALMHINYFAGKDIRTLLLGMVSFVFMGVILAFVYLKRGYGITAGAHTFWDIYVFFGIIS